MATSPELHSVHPTPAWRQKVASFWRWWTGEIARLVPERFSILRGGARIPTLALDGDDVALVEPRGATSAEARITLGALDEPRRKSALRALLERAGETRGRARVALGRDEALVRRVTMPAATGENLSQVLAYEMDRLTPFKAEDVYFDYRLISRDAASGQIVVQLAVARRDLVDARVETARALGISVQGVGVRDDSGHSGAPLDLLPSEQRGERQSSRERFIYRLMFATVIALLAIALLLPIWQKRETVIELHPLLNKAKQEAEKTDAIARELDRQVADYNYLASRKHGTPPALAYIEEMSRLLPDNTWVQQLDVKTVGKAREVQVTGETSSASKLIELLEQSTLLQNAAPRGTVTRGSQPGSERFMIAAEARPRPQPEARPVMEIVSSMPNAVPTPLPQSPPVAVPDAAIVTTEPQAAAPAQEGTPPKTPPDATATPAQGQRRPQTPLENRFREAAKQSASTPGTSFFPPPRTPGKRPAPTSTPGDARSQDAPPASN